ncbi:MAG: sugar phosphate isomerase/epimerase [Clostridiaceae bacterium]|nr:sugar phosphate isomerase/epimerase [Clostridiaceae bacterium]
MKLSISNIAWTAENDEYMYKYLAEEGIEGLEIAPTRIFNEAPYEKLSDARIFANSLKENYGLKISSMQSIWFGRVENFFSSSEERQALLRYTKKAIDFANVIGCGNLVFGCPKNRNIGSCDQYYIAVEFFTSLGEYADSKNTVIAIEPNPTIYNTNFINTTEQAFELVNAVNIPGIMVNIDLGTIIHNRECMQTIYNNIHLVNHFHISEPYLEKIQVRDMHKALAMELKSMNYDKYISIEMKNLNDIVSVEDTIKYVKEIFA